MCLVELFCTCLAFSCCKAVLVFRLVNICVNVLQSCYGLDFLELHSPDL